MPTPSRSLSVAVVAAAAAVISTSAAGLAGAMPTMPTMPTAYPHAHHHHAGKHHKAPALKKVAIDGIVKSVHHRHVAVLASTSRIGHRTAHNTTVHLTLGRHTHRSNKLRPGYVLHLAASGRGSMKHLVLPKLHTAHLAPAPASVIVGTVSEVGPSGVLVSQFSRDNGDHGRGSAAHKVSVDTTSAQIVVDGAASGHLRRGDFVAVLGEAVGANVLASQVFALTTVGETIRGTVVGVDGDNVSIRSYGAKTVVDLSSVPVFVNGSFASASALNEGDRVVVLGVVTEEEEGFVPLIAFAFNGHDNGPVGDN